MSGTTAARVQSLQAVHDFRTALQNFIAEAHGAMIDVDLELRRALEWILERQPNYWQHEARAAADALNEARNELHRARMRTLPGGGTPPCMDEKKAVDRADRRLRHAEEKVKIVRSWSGIEQHEVADYRGRASQLSTFVEGTLPKAVVMLDRVLADLEAYLAAGGAGAAPTRTSSVAYSQPPQTSAQEVAATPSAPSSETLDNVEQPGQTL